MTGLVQSFSWDDFVALPEGDRRELIDGALVETEMPNAAHELILPLLCHFLVAWALARQAGRVVASGYKVKITDKRGVMPDLQFFRSDNPARVSGAGLDAGRPDLAVEIISPGSVRYDRVVKLGWYASIGVPEYWIVDPASRTLERLVLSGDASTIAHALSEDDVFRPPSFEGLEIPLAVLWQAASDAATA